MSTINNSTRYNCSNVNFQLEILIHLLTWFEYIVLIPFIDRWFCVWDSNGHEETSKKKDEKSRHSPRKDESVFPVKSAARSKRTKSRHLSWRCLGRHYAEQRLKRWKHLPRVGKAANKQQNCRSLTTRLLWILLHQSSVTRLNGNAYFHFKIERFGPRGGCTILVLRNSYWDLWRFC